MAVFNALIEKCAQSDPQYQTLKNGFVMRSATGSEEVHISCSEDIARAILVFAEEVCSEVVPHIRRMSAPV
jgi:hypothetical protein